MQAHRVGSFLSRVRVFSCHKDVFFSNWFLSCQFFFALQLHWGPWNSVCCMTRRTMHCTAPLTKPRWVMTMIIVMTFIFTLSMTCLVHYTLMLQWKRHLIGNWLYKHLSQPHHKARRTIQINWQLLKMFFRFNKMNIFCSSFSCQPTHTGKKAVE